MPAGRFDRRLERASRAPLASPLENRSDNLIIDTGSRTFSADLLVKADREQALDPGKAVL
jgi:hypothetical protein